MEMTSALFHRIINTSQDCVFWKDKDRRFLGVNQAFLDYYGFDSMKVLLGKTDEDMGWHSDPEPFKQDELRVLSGESTYKVQGKCIIRGEERDIVASKRPLYEDDRIVGLVGSFVDVTDVIRRKNALDGSQVVYTLSDLRNYPFFDRLIDDVPLDEILDPLTGILSRAYSVKFVLHLISENIPFTFAILDLDNFKVINDRFGHSAGDKVLCTVAKELAAYTDDMGLVGRFGGDELLLIDLRYTSDAGKSSFYERLYNDSQALRIDVEFENGSAYVTGTIGAASFPTDAQDYNGLFSLIDKMLYLGKSRGRNCYNIYDEKMHKDIEVAKLANYGIFTAMSILRSLTETVEGFTCKLDAVMGVLPNMLQIHDLYYTDDHLRLRAVTDPSLDEDVSDIAALMTGDIFAENTLDKVKERSPLFYKALKANGFESAMAVKIRKHDRVYGYLICAVKRSLRIWQENECALLYYLAGLLAEDL